MKKIVLLAWLIILLILTSAPSFSQGITLLEKEMNLLFEKVKPSVVNVKYTTPLGMGRDLVTTGVVINREGHLLTTKNFSGRPKGIRVIFSNGEERESEWIGWDRDSKLAVLKVDGKNLTPATLGNSDLVKPASWVMIVGNSMGLSSSISIGHISGKREEDLLQLSANVSPGNSGAGVFNAKGELVGIVAASLSSLRILSIPRGIEEGPTPGGSGVAIPINRAMEITKRIIEKGGDIEYGWLGVYIQDLSPDLKESLDAEHGVLVSNVVERSPAEEAGIKEGDVITSFNGEKILEMRDLQRKVRMTKTGTKAKVTLLRKGEKINLDVEIRERESDFGEVVIEEPDLPSPERKGFRGFGGEFKEEELKELVERFRKEMEDLRKEMKKFKREMLELKKKKI